METMSDEMKKDVNPAGYDFGEQPDVVPAPEPAFDAWVRQVAPTLNAPAETPRAEMWNAIQAARRVADDATAGRIPGVTPLRRPPWRLMSVIAAALLLGVAIDRLAVRGPEPSTAPATAAATPRTTGDSADPSRLYRLAAAQTLTQAEALLTAYRAGGAAERDPAAAKQLSRWARDILGSTRLLMDSPAGTDPRLGTLLDDLELVLVQIVQIAGGELDPAERALIERALEDRDLLPRIRTAVPAGMIAPGAASDD
jgi:hypothetical protein